MKIRILAGHACELSAVFGGDFKTLDVAQVHERASHFCTVGFADCSHGPDGKPETEGRNGQHCV